MRALFVIKHPGALRLLGSTLRLLAERGHEVHLAFESKGTPEARALADRLVGDHPGLTYGGAPKVRRNPTSGLARATRVGLDYLRYLEPRYADAGKLQSRAAAQAPTAIRRAARLGGRTGRALLGGALRRVERSLPPPPEVSEFVAAHAPDLVLATPLVGIGSTQADYIRAAAASGIPTAFPVLSWDNLTNKGLLRDVPSLVLTWNEAQAQEAVELHGVPRERVAVTGAAAFDHWFDWEPSRTRAELCAEAGLRVDRPFLLYLCSSPFIAGDETVYFASWLARLRAVGGNLADVGVLVRPHPQNAGHWHRVDAGAQVAVWPAVGEDPLDDEGRRNYYDSMHHSAAVVGINTTALIEAAIVGRPALTVLEDRYRETQEGTLHFHHLAGGDTGLLHVARTFEEHAAALSRAVDQPDTPAPHDAFLRSFVRPHGLERQAAPIVVEALEALVSSPRPAPMGSSRLGGALARALVARDGHRRARSRKTNGHEAPRPTPAKEARLAVRRLVKQEGPILAGPWFAEVGHELLYWIPFLRWAQARDPELAGRLVAVSRGGVADWYADVCRGGYLDLYDVIGHDELRRMLEEQGARKQMGASPLDGELAARVVASAGLAEAAMLHPSLMFAAYWRLLKERGIHRHEGMFDLQPLPRPAPDAVLDARLPERFIAARFYFNASFPDNDANRLRTAAVLESLADGREVVALDPGTRFDDHWDLEVSGSGVVRIDDLMTPATNLAVQTRVLARADAYVGTYGGLSYLAPLLGVPSLAVYSDASKFRAHHLELAQRTFREPPFGRLISLDVRDMDLLRLVTAGLSAGAREV